MKKLVKESLLLEKMDTEQVIITVRKGSGERLKEFFDHIKSIGNGGHGFEIVADKGDADYEKTIYWDGDGSDQIESVELK